MRQGRTLRTCVILKQAAMHALRGEDSLAAPERAGKRFPAARTGPKVDAYAQVQRENHPQERDHNGGFGRVKPLHAEHSHAHHRRYIQQEQSDPESSALPVLLPGLPIVARVGHLCLLPPALRSAMILSQPARLGRSQLWFRAAKSRFRRSCFTAFGAFYRIRGSIKSRVRWDLRCSCTIKDSRAGLPSRPSFAATRLRARKFHENS